MKVFMGTLFPPLWDDSTFEKANLWDGIMGFPPILEPPVNLVDLAFLCLLVLEFLPPLMFFDL